MISRYSIGSLSHGVAFSYLHHVIVNIKHVETCETHSVVNRAILFDVNHVQCYR